MLGDAICVLHTQNPRALQAEPSKLRFMDLLLSLVSVYQLLGFSLVSGANGLLGLGISLARASKTLLGSFAGLAIYHAGYHAIYYIVHIHAVYLTIYYIAY